MNNGQSHTTLSGTSLVEIVHADRTGSPLSQGNSNCSLISVTLCASGSVYHCIRGSAEQRNWRTDLGLAQPNRFYVRNNLQSVVLGGCLEDLEELLTVKLVGVADCLLDDVAGEFIQRKGDKVSFDG